MPQLSSTNWFIFKVYFRALTLTYIRFFVTVLKIFIFKTLRKSMIRTLSFLCVLQLCFFFLFLSLSLPLSVNCFTPIYILYLYWKCPTFFIQWLCRLLWMALILFHRNAHFINLVELETIIFCSLLGC